jgi:peptide/nickel transport system permease protein
MKKNHDFRPNINRTMIIGSIMVGVVIFIAIAGPLFTPQDPMKENYALSANGKIHSPPYAPLEVKGYLLGTDNYGRDMLSRILAGIRPTLFTLAIVASIRLGIAIIIGIAAGWSSSLKTSKLDSVISVAISLPVLIVALITISALGSQKGLWVFIIGLALNGWAETARLVSQQTKEVKSQAYIEISRALGASTPRILLTHVVPQILPMIWMLMAYEISSTLLVLAELGFLGYYIGGGVLIPVDDWINVNVTGLPELGQILSTSLTNLTAPLVLVVTGTVIFFIILGFNLLGNGLRQHLEITHTRASLKFSFLERVSGWKLWETLSKIRSWFKNRYVIGGLILFGIIITGGAIWLSYQAGQPRQPTSPAMAPGNNYWESAGGNAQGTRYAPFIGPRETNVLWSQKPVDRFRSGPVVAGDGTIYIAGEPGTLFSYHPDGTLAWSTPLKEPPVGSPALSAEGNIYVADAQGGLSCFSPLGDIVWQFAPTSGRMSTSGPIVGKNGTVYYTRLDSVQAVSPDGGPLWYTYVSDSVLDGITPSLNFQEDLLLIKTAVVLTADGSRLNTDLFIHHIPGNFFSDPYFFVGADGNMYFRVGHEALAWKFKNGKYFIEKTITWDIRDPQATYPPVAGVNSRGWLWFYYPYLENTVQIVWINPEKNRIESRGLVPGFRTQIIGNDKEDVIFLCEIRGTPTCYGLNPGDDQYTWEVTMPAGLASTEIWAAAQIWGALAPGRLYVATQDGYLYALGDASTP